jgi:hypothetical protein
VLDKAVGHAPTQEVREPRELSVPDNDHTRVSLFADRDERVPHAMDAVTGDELLLRRESSLLCDLDPLLQDRGCLLSRLSLNSSAVPGSAGAVTGAPTMPETIGTGLPYTCTTIAGPASRSPVTRTACLAAPDPS